MATYCSNSALILPHPFLILSILLKILQDGEDRAEDGKDKGNDYLFDHMIWALAMSKEPLVVPPPASEYSKTALLPNDEITPAYT